MPTHRETAKAPVRSKSRCIHDSPHARPLKETRQRRRSDLNLDLYMIDLNNALLESLCSRGVTRRGTEGAVESLLLDLYMIRHTHAHS